MAARRMIRNIPPCAAIDATSGTPVRVSVVGGGANSCRRTLPSVVDDPLNSFTAEAASSEATKPPGIASIEPPRISSQHGAHRHAGGTGDSSRGEDFRRLFTHASDVLDGCSIGKRLADCFSRRLTRYSGFSACSSRLARPQTKKGVLGE